MTLTEFLLARIAEDEETARAADGPRWFHHDKVVTFEAFGPDSGWVDASSPISVDTRANGWHIVRWSPARVLAECEAKRQIVEMALHLIASFDDVDAEDAVRSGGRQLWPDVNRRERSHAWGRLATLATVYADHPDYDEEWKP